MKRMLLVVFLTLVVISVLLAGCGSASLPADTSQSTSGSTQGTQPTGSTSDSSVSTTAGSSGEAKTLKIGVLEGLTGPGAMAWMQDRDAVLLCQKWINDNGGITVDGQKYLIECVVEDNKMSPAGAVEAATKLVMQDGVKFIIRGLIPNQVAAVCTVTEPNGVLYASDRTDKPDPTRKLHIITGHLFTLPILPLYEAFREADPGVKSIGAIAEDDPGARATYELTKQMNASSGLQFLDAQVHPWESSEYYPQWTNLVAQKPDAVDVGLKISIENMAACIRQGRELGYAGPMLSAVDMDIRLLVGLIGDPESADGVFLQTYDPYSEAAPAFIKDTVLPLWDQTYDYEFTSSLAEAWDNLWLLTQVIEQAQSIDPVEVAEAWKAAKGLECCSGTATMGGQQAFGVNNCTLKPLAFSRLDHGKGVLIKWATPQLP